MTLDGGIGISPPVAQDRINDRALQGSKGTLVLQILTVSTVCTYNSTRDRRITLLDRRNAQEANPTKIGNRGPGVPLSIGERCTYPLEQESQ